MTLISLDDSTNPISPSVGDHEGGFAWWYFDWIGPEGESVVVIASFGLPFLPGHGSAARDGSAPPARSCPSLNVVVTRKGTNALYLLQRYEEHDATWSDTEMRLGASVLRTETRDGRRVFEAVLDCPLPRTSDRLRGRIVLDAASLRFGDAAPGALHRWTPLGVGDASVELCVGERDLVRGVGRAYHDRNASPVHLGGLGIRHWLWSRTPLPSGDLVTYLLWPEGGGEPRIIARHLGLDGAVRPLEGSVERSGTRLAWCGMPWWRRIRLNSPEGVYTIDHTEVIDDGPFYLRLHTRVQAPDGSTGGGVAEAVRPGRVDWPLTRPFVRMAVHDLRGSNSFWVPLFAGEKRGRVARLLATQPRAVFSQGTR